MPRAPVFSPLAEVRFRPGSSAGRRAFSSRKSVTAVAVALLVLPCIMDPRAPIRALRSGCWACWAGAGRAARETRAKTTMRMRWDMVFSLFSGNYWNGREAGGKVEV